MTKLHSSFRPVVFSVLLMAIALAAVWMLRTATPYGLAMRNDSVQYIFGARNLLAGNGYTRTSGGGELKPITTVPPLFSTVIAAVSLTGLEAQRAARLLSFALFGVNVLLLGYLTWRLARNRVVALAGAAFFAFSAVSLGTFVWLMSEPLYLALWFTSFIVFEWYVGHPRLGWLLLLGLLAGLAYLTRYVGVSLAITLCLALVLFEPGWRRKLRAVLAVGLPFIACTTAWSIRNQLATGNPANRTLGFHPVTSEKLYTGVDHYWAWFLPDGPGRFVGQHPEGFRIMFLLGFVLAMAALVVVTWRIFKHAEGYSPLPVHRQAYLAVGLYAPVYILLTLVSMSFVDASTVLDQRLILPFVLPVLILLMVGCAWLVSRPGWLSRLLTGLLLLAWIGLTLADGLAAVSRFRQDGLGFSSLGVRQSPTIQYLQNLPDRILYTNKAYLLYIVSGRPAYMLVGPFDPVTGAARAGYAEELAAMRSAIRSGQAVLVFFKDPGYATDAWFLEITSGLSPIRDFYDGTIFGAGD